MSNKSIFSVIIRVSSENDKTFKIKSVFMFLFLWLIKKIAFLSFCVHLKKSIWNVLFAFLWNSTINHQKLPLTFDICDILVSQIWASAGVLAFFPHFLLASSKIQILVNYNDKKKKSQEHFRLLSSIVFASFFKKWWFFPKKCLNKYIS